MPLLNCVRLRHSYCDACLSGFPTTCRDNKNALAGNSGDSTEFLQDRQQRKVLMIRLLFESVWDCFLVTLMYCLSWKFCAEFLQELCAFPKIQYLFCVFVHDHEVTSVSQVSPVCTAYQWMDGHLCHNFALLLCTPNRSGPHTGEPYELQREA